MLAVFTLLLMLITAYAFWREGLMTAVTMFGNVLLAGLVAFNFWEPIADLVDPMVAGTFLAGYEDSICLMALFTATLATFRLITNSLANTDLDYPGALWRAGNVLLGLATGYLVAGFLVCVFQTLPWHENFLWFEWRYDPSAPTAPLRQFLPPDRVWLSLMRYTGSHGFSDRVDEQVKEPESLDQLYVTFDPYATFEVRYARYRRYGDGSDVPHPYLGEFDKEIHRQPP
jgi:hypothetical protein